jgi:hypothetical protein
MYIYISSKSSCCIEENNTNSNIPMANSKIKIKVNSQTFMATLLDNKSVKEFKEMLPLNMQMTELNGNEKYFDLPNSIPTNSYNPQTIKNGDLMLYGSKTFVLFYKTFYTPYSYTKLGSLDDLTGLTSALGSGDIAVTFELE